MIPTDLLRRVAPGAHWRTRLRTVASVAALSVIVFAVGCRDGRDHAKDRPDSVRMFPEADRPVSQASDSFSSETRRDSLHEARTVMDLAKVRPGMTVADIGAGGGYYTVRLSPKVGRKGRVLAEDIDPDAIRDLGLRIEREHLENVSIRLGQPDDPQLPDASFDRIFLVHMYHEVREPYAFLWHLRPALRRQGRVIVVETDRATNLHGIPPALLFCEMGSVGFRLTEFVRKPELQGYYAQFEVAGPRPEPAQITPCRLSGTAPVAKS